MDKVDSCNSPFEINDDACGGLRGKRAVFSKDLAAFLSDAYGFDRNAEYTDLGGSSSLNLLVRADNMKHVVRVYRPYVTPNRLKDVRRVKAELSGNGIPCAAAIKTGHGQVWAEFAGRLVEVERFVAHTGIMDTMDRIKQALPLFGKMTSIMGDIRRLSPDGRNPMFANYLHIKKAIEMTRMGCARIMNWHPTDYEHELVADALELAEKVMRAGEQLFTALPQQLAHGDFWHNNVLFNRSEIVLVADFDFMGVRERIDDIALTLYFANHFMSHAPIERSQNDAVSSARAMALRELLDLYDSGLTAPLTDAERLALPIALALQPLWSIGGWIALLDDEAAARNHASDMLWYVRWANDIMDHLSEWQGIFCR